MVHITALCRQKVNFIPHSFLIWWWFLENNETKFLILFQGSFAYFHIEESLIRPTLVCPKKLCTCRQLWSMWTPDG